MNKKDPKTQTGLLLQLFGERELFRIWAENGMYKSADLLSERTGIWISEYVMRYLSNKFNWKRVVTDKNLPIYRGILNGSQPREYYKHIIFNWKELRYYVL